MMLFRIIFNHMMKINKISGGRLKRNQPNHLAMHLADFKDDVRKLTILIEHRGFLLTNY